MEIEPQLDRPDWDTLFAFAAAQDGYFTTQQAAEAGYSPQLLVHHIKSGKVARVRRGIYRIIHFPAGEHEELVVLWLWSEQQGIFSHQTALALHGLSDVLPSQVHLTLPASWKHRRFRIPPGVVLHHADIASSDRTWAGSIPITSPSRTLADCAASHLSPELLRQAVEQALVRGIVSKTDRVKVQRALEPLGEPPA